MLEIVPSVPFFIPLIDRSGSDRLKGEEVATIKEHTHSPESPSRERDIELNCEISEEPTHQDINRSGSDRLKEGEVDANTLTHSNPESKDQNDDSLMSEEIQAIEQKDDPNKDTEKMEEINRFCVLLFLLRNQEIREPDEITKSMERIISEPFKDEKEDSQINQDFNLKEIHEMKDEDGDQITFAAEKKTATWIKESSELIKIMNRCQT